MTAESDDMQLVGATLPTAFPIQDTGALEAWLHRALSERFDSTLDEALPPELTCLLGGLH